MDIIASVLAYLGFMTGIIGALAISFFVYFSPLPDTASVKGAAAPIKQTAVNQTAAKQTIAKQTLITGVASTPRLASVAAAPARQDDKTATAVAPNAKAPRKLAAASPVQVQAMRSQYVRRLVQEERAKRWAYEQDPSFENRFMGYAD